MFLLHKDPFPCAQVNDTFLILGTPKGLENFLAKHPNSPVILLVGEHQNKQRLKSVYDSYSHQLRLVSPNESFDEQLPFIISAALDAPYFLEWVGYWRLCSQRSCHPIYGFLYSPHSLPAQTPKRLIADSVALEKNILDVLHANARNYSFSLYVCESV